MDKNFLILDGSFWNNPQTKSGHLGVRNIEYEYILTLATEFKEGIEYYKKVKQGVNEDSLIGTWAPSGEGNDITRNDFISVKFSFYFYADRGRDGEGISKSYGTNSIFFDFDTTNGWYAGDGGTGCWECAKIGARVENSAALSLLKRLKYEKVSDLVWGTYSTDYDKIIEDTTITITYEKINLTEEDFISNKYYYYKQIEKP